MKIAFLNDGIYTYALGIANTVGGAERQQWLLACALVARGWRVTVGVRELLKAGECRTINGVDFVSISQGQFFFRFLSFSRLGTPTMGVLARRESCIRAMHCDCKVTRGAYGILYGL